MKVFCNRTDLNKAVNNVSHAVPVRTTSAILENIMMEFDGKQLKLTATDTTITIETIIAAEGDNAAAFAVPAKLFGSIVAKLPEEEVMLVYDEEKKKLAINCGGTRAELVCWSADEFPKLRFNEGDNKIMLPKEDVKKIIRKTAFSASADEFNGVLTGVLLTIRDGIMQMVAVDPFRIAKYNVAVESDADVEVIIPAKLASDVAKIIDDSEDKMSIEVVDKKVIFNFDNNKVVINTFSGKYIDYQRILNKEGSIKLRIKRDELLKSIDRAALLSSIQKNNLIKFDIKNDIININSLSDEGNIEEKIEVIKEGDDLLIGLNAKYLKDAISVIEDEEITMIFMDQVNPCIIKPLKGDKYVYLVLPIRIN